MKRNQILPAAASVVLLGAVAACGGGDSSTAAGSTASSAGTASSSAPSGAAAAGLTGCPKTIAIQTSWFPEADYGGVYNLIGPNGSFDATKGVYSGPLGDTGVKVEVRAGGPLTGNEQVTAQLYKDPSLMIGLLATDEAIQNSASQPTTAVMNYYDKDPQILMYDPSTYDFTSIADIGRSDAKVLYFEGSTYMDYLTGAGILKSSQVDGSYTGAPDRFVSAEGKVVQSGLMTSEPYKYQNDISQWKKPVKPLLVFDSGYVNYASSFSLIPATKAKYSECLKGFIPMAQKAVASWLADPTAMDDRIDQMNAEIGDFWQTSKGQDAAAVKAIKDNALMANDTAGTFGTFDTARVQKMIELLTPVMAKANKPLKSGLAPADLVDNSYVDPSIGIG